MAKVDVKKALSKYGYVATLANTIPDLRKILVQAAEGNWSVDQFTRAVQDSGWWKNSSDRVKQTNILRATKPGEYQAQRNEMVGKVRRMAGQLGVGLTEGHAGTLAHMVDAAMQFGWTDDDLKTNLGAHWRMVRGQEAGGDAGATTQKLRQIYASYGVPYSQDSVARATRAILMGRATIDTYMGQAIQHAKSRYAALAPQIDQGMTVKDIADPYMQVLSNTLELPQGKVDLNDKWVQKALTARDDKGQPTVQPLWQFERAVKEDPRWQKTKGAANSTYDMLRRIQQDWGFG